MGDEKARKPFVAPAREGSLQQLRFLEKVAQQERHIGGRRDERLQSRHARHSGLESDEPHMSLKWRIALGYSALLIVAITAMSGIIVWRFQQILYDQARDER